MLKIFIGYDSREPDAYDACAYSLRKHSSMPLAIHALKQDRLRARGLYMRPEDEPASTEFAFTRFLVPLLSEYRGEALFCDSDFIFTRDIKQLVFESRAALVEKGSAVAVVKHNYIPRNSVKMDGQLNVPYPRKNWSSLMYFNCEHTASKYLNAERVSLMTPSALHRFDWCLDGEVAALPGEWNFLVGEYQDWPFELPPAGIHFTNGGPWFEQCRDVQFADIWLQYHAESQRR